MVSLGSVYNQKPDFYRACVEAFPDPAWRVVMLVGERIDPAVIGAVPEHVEIHSAVNQLDVLSRATVFLSAAGVGGVMEALHCGVPQVTMPVTPEQEVNAKRVAQLGLGVRIAAGTVTAAVVRDAVERTAQDRDIAVRVARMREEVIASGGAVAAADVIEAAAG